MDALPFELESHLERRITSEPDWRAGVEWGVPRSGHPEGAVKFDEGDEGSRPPAHHRQNFSPPRLPAYPY